VEDSMREQENMEKMTKDMDGKNNLKKNIRGDNTNHAHDVKKKSR